MRLITVAWVLFLAGTACHAESLRVSGNRLFIPVEINGVAVEGLLDSAAEVTLVDVGFAERLGLSATGRETARGTGGTAEARFAEHVRIHGAGVSLDDRTIAIIDLSDISARLVGEPVQVIVGRELFDSGRFFLDIENRAFRLLGAGEEATGMRLTLRDHKGIKQLPMIIEGVPDVLADFDLGNGSEMLVGRQYAAERGLLGGERVIGSKEGGGIGGALSRTLVVLGSIELAGVEFREVVAAVDPTEDAPAANVGVSILRNFVMTIDFPANAVWLDPRVATAGDD